MFYIQSTGTHIHIHAQIHKHTLPQTAKKTHPLTLRSETGNPRRDRNRNPPIDPPIRNVTNATADIPITRRQWNGAVGHVDEVSVQRHGSNVSVTAAAGGSEVGHAAANGVFAGAFEERCG